MLFNNKLLDAFKNGKDTCAICGSLFDTHGSYTNAECPSCRKYEFERNQKKKLTNKNRL